MGYGKYDYARPRESKIVRSEWMRWRYMKRSRFATSRMQLDVIASRLSIRAQRPRTVTSRLEVAVPAHRHSKVMIEEARGGPPTVGRKPDGKGAGNGSKVNSRPSEHTDQRGHQRQRHAPVLRRRCLRRACGRGPTSTGVEKHRSEGRKGRLGPASVASFFISRIDSAVDAMANARLKTAAFLLRSALLLRSIMGRVAPLPPNSPTSATKKINLSGDRWQRLTASGAQTQAGSVGQFCQDGP